MQRLSASVIGKYTRELGRLQEHCELQGVYMVQVVTRELLTGFCATWEKDYPSSSTRSKVRERCRSFLKYCYQAEWLERIPELTKVKVDAAPTLPLTADEYKRLLDAAPNPRVRALFQLMRCYSAASPWKKFPSCWVTPVSARPRSTTSSGCKTAPIALKIRHAWGRLLNRPYARRCVFGVAHVPMTNLSKRSLSRKNKGLPISFRHHFGGKKALPR